MAVGYVVMRIAMVAQWLRAAREDRRRRATCLVYVATISVVQIGWVVLIFADLSIGDTFGCAAVLLAIELSGPSIAEAVTRQTVAAQGRLRARARGGADDTVGRGGPMASTACYSGTR